MHASERSVVAPARRVFCVPAGPPVAGGGPSPRRALRLGHLAVEAPRERSGDRSGRFSIVQPNYPDLRRIEEVKAE
eukprot:3462681-Pyramimonas_sp.AAC.1